MYVFFAADTGCTGDRDLGHRKQALVDHNEPRVQDRRTARGKVLLFASRGLAEMSYSLEYRDRRFSVPG